MNIRSARQGKQRWNCFADIQPALVSTAFKGHTLLVDFQLREGQSHLQLHSPLSDTVSGDIHDMAFWWLAHLPKHNLLNMSENI